MNKNFSRIITFLRKEKKISQKQAAQELGISQALLSHYEKGIRECGLDFVVKAADYYNVSCDYLLGRTAVREYDISDSVPERESNRQRAAQIINRRLISSMTNVIYDYSAASKNRRLDRSISNYIMICLYNLFRRLYSVNSDNPQDIFTVSAETYGGYASASMIKIFTDIENLTDKSSGSSISALESIDISFDKLADEYPETVGEIFNVIQQAENTILKIKM